MGSGVQDSQRFSYRGEAARNKLTNYSITQNSTLFPYDEFWLYVQFFSTSFCIKSLKQQRYILSFQKWNSTFEYLQPRHLDIYIPLKKGNGNLCCQCINTTEVTKKDERNSYPSANDEYRKQNARIRIGSKKINQPRNVCAGQVRALAHIGSLTNYSQRSCPALHFILLMFYTLIDLSVWTVSTTKHGAEINHFRISLQMCLNKMASHGECLSSRRICHVTREVMI